MVIEGSGKPPQAEASLRAIRLLTLLGLTVAFGMVAMGAGVLLDLRRDAWRQATQSSENLSIAMEREIARTIAVYDLSLQGAVEALAQPGIDLIPAPLRHAAIFDRAANADFLGSLLVLDKDGNIVDDSTAIEPHRLNLADRDYFQVHRDNPDHGLFVSRPFRSRLRNNDPSISISRRLQDRDGNFAGVVLGTLKLAYFTEMFSRVHLPADTTVLLERTDGHLVLRQPSLPGDLDRDLTATLLAKATVNEPSGAFMTHSPIDGVDRWVIYRQVGSLPLALAIATSIQSIYATWWQKAVGIGAILLVLSSATMMLILLFRREMLRRISAEAALFDAASELSVMAATDALTGLANRRRFEEDLLYEWKRAIRSKTTVSLLMLDADWFKAFNDRYGHVEGDDVLRQLAKCIIRNIRRPGDVGARYGGEEFVVLLPETDLAGAALIAERICGAVANLIIPHEGSPLGRVSVSVGVAVARPVLGDSERNLVRDADLSLYGAKRSGRARVVVATEPSRQAVRLPDEIAVGAN